MHTTVVIDELKMDDFLNPEKDTIAKNIKKWFYNWNSEFNIKKKVALASFPHS